MSTAEKYLKLDWKLTAMQVDLLLKAWILKSDAPLAVMRSISTSLIKPDHGDLDACTAANFHAWYSVLLNLLSKHVAKQVSSS